LSSFGCHRHGAGGRSGYQVRKKPMSPGIPPGYSSTSALR
jgi:hypothetical protein